MAHEAYVDAAAQALGLAITPEQRPGVLRFFGLAAAMAARLDAVPLTVAEESGSVFTPLAPATGDETP
jgi:hypothetical protein